MEKKTGEIGALQHFETAAEKGNFGCTYKVCKSFSGMEADRSSIEGEAKVQPPDGPAGGKVW